MVKFVVFVGHSCFTLTCHSFELKCNVESFPILICLWAIIWCHHESSNLIFYLAMMDNLREVVDVVSSNVSCSAPDTPITRHPKSFLNKTLIPRVDAFKWKQGVPTPIIEGSLTLNQEAFGLLAGFATGSIRMRGDVVQHLPTVQGNKSIGDNLQEIPWYFPKGRKVDGSAIHTRKQKSLKRNLKST